MLAGRGFGKTRTSAEWIREQAESGAAKNIALVGRTAADVRDVMVTGPSGILSCHPPDKKPVYEPSRRRLIWPNGAVAHTYTSEKPDQLRGPQHDCFWGDEIAAWSYPQDTWDQIMFGLRLGQSRGIVSSTPRPIQLVRDLIAAPSTRVTRGNTFANRDNLSNVFFEQIVSKYEGTSLGRQELYAEVLNELPGALWTRAMVDAARFPKTKLPSMKRIVVAVDPAVTNKDTSDETGIVVVGKDADNHFYLLEDVSGRMSVDRWARLAVECYHKYSADRVVAEVNQGGDLVEQMIRQVDSGIPYKAVRASRGKYARAEPVAARYEQGMVHHVGGFPLLEDQLCTFSPDYMSKSPDRLDALVWAITELDTRKVLDLRIDPNANHSPRNWF